MKTNNKKNESVNMGLNANELNVDFSILSECVTREQLVACANKISECLKADFAKYDKQFTVEVAKPTKKAGASKAAKTAPKAEEPKKQTRRTKKSEAKVEEPKAEKKSASKSAKKTSKTKERKERVYENQVSMTNARALKKLNIKWEQYSDKCYVLRGEDCKRVANYLRNTMNLKYRDFANGWLIPQSKAEAVKKALHIA